MSTNITEERVELYLHDRDIWASSSTGCTASMTCLAILSRMLVRLGQANGYHSQEFMRTDLPMQAMT